MNAATIILLVALVLTIIATIKPSHPLLAVAVLLTIVILLAYGVGLLRFPTAQRGAHLHPRQSALLCG